MPTDVTKLKVSLTKHGAHKVAYLIRAFDKDEILTKLDGQFDNIKIEHAQTRKVLAAENGTVPRIWNEIKKYGDEDIFDLVFVAITFSHAELIRALTVGFENECVINRGEVIDGKAYTNFAHELEEFGFSVEHTVEYVSYDISRIFYKFYLPPLISSLLQAKLLEIGWDKKNTLTEECIRLEWNKAFGLDPEIFARWLSSGVELPTSAIEKVKAKRKIPGGIAFRAGHRTKMEGQVPIAKSDKQIADLLHNKIQNKCFLILQKSYPNEVGTEIKTNGGSIDIVRRTKDNELFLYEIKTSSRIKSNIRQALSQLMEYAYWDKIDGVIRELVIIGPSKPSDAAKLYLQFLRKKLSIPVYFQYFDLDSGELSSTV